MSLPLLYTNELNAIQISFSQTKFQILFKKMLTTGLYYKEFGYHWHFFVEAEAAVEVVSREQFLATEAFVEALALKMDFAEKKRRRKFIKIVL